MSSRRVAVVTGSNKGLGFAIAKALCEKYDGDVYVIARDGARGEEAVQRLKKLGLKPLFHLLDITEQASVDRFKKYLKTEHGGIDILINNAAIMLKCSGISEIQSAVIRGKLNDRNLSIEGLNKLMDKFVQDAADGKDVNKSWGRSAYITSKVGVSCLVGIQQRIFDAESPNRNISVNSVHPGFLDTDMVEHKGNTDPDDGARAPLYLALEANIKGKYVWKDCSVIDWYTSWIVTGSNKGLGYAVVKGLCEKFNGDVYLTARDVGRGEQAVQKLKKLGFNPLFHQLDITDQASVDRFRDHLKTKHNGIDILVNNAAILFEHRSSEPESYKAKEQIRVNYYGTLRVSNALGPLLRQNGRIIHVTSAAGHLSEIQSVAIREKIDDKNLNIEGLNKLMDQYVQEAKDGLDVNKSWANWAYGTSKVGVSCLVGIQQKLFDNERPNRNISVNSVHPGFLDTDMVNHRGNTSPDDGAKPILFLALEADLKGKYVWKNCSVIDWYTSTLVKPN